MARRMKSEFLLLALLASLLFLVCICFGSFLGGPFGGLHFLVATIIHDMTSPALGASGRIFLFDFNTLLFDILCYGAFYYQLEESTFYSSWQNARTNDTRLYFL